MDADDAETVLVPVAVEDVGVEVDAHSQGHNSTETLHLAMKHQVGSVQPVSSLAAGKRSWAWVSGAPAVPRWGPSGGELASLAAVLANEPLGARTNSLGMLPSMGPARGWAPAPAPPARPAGRRAGRAPPAGPPSAPAPRACAGPRLLPRPRPG